LTAAGLDREIESITSRLEGLMESRLKAKRMEAAKLESYSANLRSEHEAISVRIQTLSNTLKDVVATLQGALEALGKK
jgi:hypothetical protein